MGKFEVGDIVLVHFPFSDLKGKKLRPALVVAKAEFENLILCQITSKSYSSKTAVHLTSEEFSEGGLPVKSFIRPDKLFIAKAAIIVKTAGKLTTKKRQKILMTMRNLFEEK